MGGLSTKAKQIPLNEIGKMTKSFFSLRIP
jgi:hypothetical protein